MNIVLHFPVHILIQLLKLQMQGCMVLQVVAKFYKLISMVLEILQFLPGSISFRVLEVLGSIILGFYRL